MTEKKQALALIQVSDLMDYFLTRADDMPDELGAQFIADIAFGMNHLNPKETLRIPTKGVIYRG